VDEILEVDDKIPYVPQYGGSVSSLENEVEHDRVFIGGMFPKGVVSALIAESGIGKTWVMAGCSLSATSGIPFLPTEDYEPIDSGKVLIIDTEGRIVTFVKRVKALGGKTEYYITPRKNPKEIARYSNDADVADIELILEHEKPELIIIDSFAGFSTVDENTYQVNLSLQWMMDVASRYYTAVVFTQLTNKSEQRNGRITTKSIRGFSGIHQFAEIIWGLDCPSNDSTVKRLYEVKNNINQKSSVDYYFELNNSQITWKDSELDSKQRRHKILKENLGLSNVDIARKIVAGEPNVKLKSIETWVGNNRPK
jgi:RecA-family ATPase